MLRCNRRSLPLNCFQYWGILHTNIRKEQKDKWDLDSFSSTKKGDIFSWWICRHRIDDQATKRDVANVWCDVIFSFLTLFELLPEIVSVIDSWIAQMIIYPSYGNSKIIESLSSPLYISYKKCPSITIMNIYIKCVYKICTIWKTMMVVVSYQIL